MGGWDKIEGNEKIEFSEDEKKSLIKRFQKKLAEVSDPENSSFGSHYSRNEIIRMRNLLDRAGINLGATELDQIRRMNMVDQILNADDEVTEEKLRIIIKDIGKFATALLGESDGRMLIKNIRRIGGMLRAAAEESVIIED